MAAMVCLKSSMSALRESSICDSAAGTWRASMSAARARFVGEARVRAGRRLVVGRIVGGGVGWVAG